MSKNYKIWVYTEVPCPPCENLGTYPSSSAATKGYEFEETTFIVMKHILIGYQNQLVIFMERLGSN